MFFTSQYFSFGQQADTCSTRRDVFSSYEMNRQSASICSARKGNLPEQCALPGNGENRDDRDRNSSADMLTQNHFSMKNARKQLGEIASNAVQINPGPIVSDNPESLPLFENQIFHEKPRPRQPESPDTELFRSLLKSNMPRPTASEALLERIKAIARDEKA